VRKFRFTPQQLVSFTVPECVGLYLQAVIDQAEAENPKGDQDHSLAPHLIDEAKAQFDRALKVALAYDKMTPDQKLIMARRLYG
jgi:hypothetical protein